MVGSNGTSLMTDPCLPEAEKVVSLDDLPHLDGIVLSSTEMDLGSWERLAAIRSTAPVVVPRGMGKKISDLGFTSVHEIRSGKTFTIGDMKVTTLPAKGSRDSYGILFTSQKNVYFAGPTQYFEKLAAIGNTYAIDLALLPIGGKVRGSRSVMSPEEAAEATARLRAKSVVPIHWHPVAVGGEQVRPPGRPEEFQKIAKKSKVRVRILRPSDAIII